MSPTLAARTRAGRVVSPIRGAVRLPNQIRRATGPGWALVGDAGYHRDPITGHGITDAFRNAELLTRSIDEHLRGEAADLSGYETARDAVLRDTFDITCAMSRYPALDEFVAPAEAAQPCPGNGGGPPRLAALAHGRRNRPSLKGVRHVHQRR